jgi:hypothetical protein
VQFGSSSAPAQAEMLLNAAGQLGQRGEHLETFFVCCSKAALTSAQYRSPLGRRPYDLRHAAVSLWLNSGVPAPRSPAAPGTASRSCSRSTRTASTGRLMPPTSGSPRPSAPATPRKTPVTRATATPSRHRNRSRRPRPWPFRPRPWLVRARPWAARIPEPGTHGRIADGGGPQTRLEWRMRWSAGGGSGRASGL